MPKENERKREKKTAYPEIGDAGLLAFKAFQKSIKTKDDPRIQNALATIYRLCDGFLEALDGLRADQKRRRK